MEVTARHDPGLPPGVEGVRAAGPDAVLVEVSGHVEAVALAAWLRSAGPACREVVPAASTVLLDGVGRGGLVRTAALVRRWPGPGRRGISAGAVEIPVTYDGADLARVAGLWGTDPAGVVRRHTGLDLVSAFCGFAPGFSYLAGLPRDLAVPRLEVPRPSVPAGSVALADRWCGIYPAASPGGWLLLGHTEVDVWDPDRAEPALLPPGTRVRFVVA